MEDLDLDDFYVAAPCPASWADMRGDERKRRCAACKLNVYNVASMTKREAETLISQHEGQLCMRLYRRPDGTIITKDCPTGLDRRRRRRQGFGLLAALGVLFGVGLGKALVDSKDAAHSSTPRTGFKAMVGKPLDFVSHKFGIRSLCNCPAPIVVGVIRPVPVPVPPPSPIAPIAPVPGGDTTAPESPVDPGQ